MPIYEYFCETCDTEFEVRRSFSATGVPVCPRCNGTGKVRRKFSVPAIVFKGSGFYVTDNRGKNGGITTKPATKEGSKNGNNGTKTKEPSASKEKSVDSKDSGTSSGET